MNASPILLVALFIGGTLFGLLLAYIFKMLQTANAEKIAQEILRKSEQHRLSDEKELLTRVKDSFGKLSADALSQSSEQFLKLAETRLSDKTNQHTAELDSKKQLIDQQLKSMNDELGRVTALVKEFELDRQQKFGALSKELTSLGQTSALLQNALADNRARGQWGERMAEDILRALGFMEGVNYRKQKSLEDGTRPDYTFLLPKNLCLNMDVKFPLAKYMAYQNATSDTDRIALRNEFLKAVRDRISEVVKRGYIDPTQSTVDCVLIFIPNEQIYRFIHEEDDGIINYALNQKVILCSPLTLYTVLAIIRQATDNFTIEQSSHLILLQLANFRKEWGKFVDKMRDVEKHFKRASAAYDDLLGTRTNVLEKHFKRIDDLMTIYQPESDENEISLLEADAASDEEFVAPVSEMVSIGEGQEVLVN